MNKVASSFSLSAYDFLAVLIPGGIILSSIIYGFLKDCSIEPNTPEWFYYTLLFIIAYLLGLIWKMFMDWVFNLFRNNLDDIRMCCKGVAKKSKINDSLLLREYLSAYYWLQKESVLGQIPIIERQIAFVRNTSLLVPLLGSLICNFFKGFNGALLSHFLFSIGLIIVYLIIIPTLLYWLHKTQLKVYQLVLEGCYYMNMHETRGENTTLYSLESCYYTKTGLIPKDDIIDIKINDTIKFFVSPRVLITFFAILLFSYLAFFDCTAIVLVYIEITILIKSIYNCIFLSVNPSSLFY